MKKTKKDKQPIRVLIPKNCERLEDLFSTLHEQDGARIILYHIHLQYRKLLQDDSYAPALDREERFAPVLASSLQKLAGNKYNAVVEVLLEHQIIERRTSYRTGKYSMKYRIHKRLWNTTRKERFRMETIIHKAVIKATNDHYKAHDTYRIQKSKLLKYDPIYHELTCSSEKYIIDIPRMQQDMKNGIIPQDDEAICYAYNFNLGFTKWTKVDDFGHRLHLDINGLHKKKLRPYLVLKQPPKTKLLIADIKNSQPYFIGAMLTNSSLLELIPEFLPVRYRFEKFSQETGTKIFFNHCQQGLFMQHWLVSNGLIPDLETKPSSKLKGREKKKMFRSIFYCGPNNHHKPGSKLHKERKDMELKFNIQYRSVLDALKYLKRVRKNELPFLEKLTRKGKKSGRMFTLPSCAAQRIESEVVLLRLTKRFYERVRATGSKTLAVSIHDAVIFEEQHHQIFMDTFKEVFQELDIKAPELDIQPLYDYDISIEPKK